MPGMFLDIVGGIEDPSENFIYGKINKIFKEKNVNGARLEGSFYKGYRITGVPVELLDSVYFAISSIPGFEPNHVYGRKSKK